MEVVEVISDACGSNGARSKKASSPHVPTPASHLLAPWSRPPFQSFLFFRYLNLVQWSGLLIHGRPTTQISTAY